MIGNIVAYGFGLCFVLAFITFFVMAIKHDIIDIIEATKEKDSTSFYLDEKRRKSFEIEREAEKINKHLKVEIKRLEKEIALLKEGKK